jgi:hypothetical protein
MNSTIKTASKVAEELSQSYENIYAKKGRYATHKKQDTRVLKEEMRKERKAWPVY